MAFKTGSIRGTLDKDIYDLVPGHAEERPQLPGSLDEALDALETATSFC